MEIEDKKQELLEMDQALKERNWELKQRAAQVDFLILFLAVCLFFSNLLINWSNSTLLVHNLNAINTGVL